MSGTARADALGNPASTPSDAEHTYLIYPGSYPDEGEMLIAHGRKDIVHILATRMVFGEKSVAHLSAEHAAELDRLMEQFDDPDEWSGADMAWAFEDGRINVTRLDPAIAAPLTASPPPLAQHGKH